jgi:hypothetical protein
VNGHTSAQGVAFCAKRFPVAAAVIAITPNVIIKIFEVKFGMGALPG